MFKLTKDRGTTRPTVCEICNGGSIAAVPEYFDEMDFESDIFGAAGHLTGAEFIHDVVDAHSKPHISHLAWVSMYDGHR